MELAGILGDNRPTLHHPRRHEHPAHPALDGGHVLFLLVEVITGRKPGDKFMTYAQIAGMLLLFTLIIYATGNDIYRLFIK